MSGVSVDALLRRRFKLRSIIICLVIIVVAISLFITDVLVSNTISDQIMDDQEEKALTVARIVAESETVQQSLAEETPENIQVFANDIRSTSGVLFIVVMDMNGIRYSHPNADLVGLPFEGEDEANALMGQEYSSISKGTLETSLRSFTPVMSEDNEQLGAVAVGISLENVEQTLDESHKNLIIGSLFGIITGIIGALLIANYIKKILYGLEPFTIAKTFEERNTMLQSVREGIIAVDKDARITLVNKSGLQLFAKAGLKNDPIGMEITEYMPRNGLEEVLQTGNSELDSELTINGMSFVVNRTPLIVDNQIIGAISTFRDKTEVNEMAKQLSGVKLYAEALRSQSHEVMNKFHVILGLVRNRSYEELSHYIRELVDHKNNEIGIVTRNIKDPVLAGFLIGKLSYARENGITLNIINETDIPSPKSSDTTHELITILGNLIDNVIEALTVSKSNQIDVKLSYDQGSLKLQVEDTGPGIKRQHLAHIFEKGFSTKGKNRGYGLFLVKNSMDKLGGNFTVDSFQGEGTVFTMDIPYEIEVNGID
ncbi:DcuS/MalK family sensor histidine kinase [Salipaludibacillus neizhouensis]|uniref:DcuS/MalK family sensor histidine kinase n=1 Tax=Salipaludibacillus neizhouensis TaxID=885475 RepID=UPI001CBA67F6|nr:DcuS/MalK family sensor histidine kinase [Salipaludibacillus neizhouensis]